MPPPGGGPEAADLSLERVAVGYTQRLWHAAEAQHEGGRGVVARADHQHEQVLELQFGELLAVDGGLEQLADDVVRRAALAQLGLVLGVTVVMLAFAFALVFRLVPPSWLEDTGPRVVLYVLMAVTAPVVKPISVLALAGLTLASVTVRFSLPRPVKPPA